MAVKATIRQGDATVAASSTEVEAIRDANQFKDGKGRIIKLRTLSVIEEMRLLKVLGEYNSSYYNFCAQVARVSEIDGSAIPVPNSEREIEAVAARLGKEGIAAMMAGIADANAADDTAEKEQVKKS